MGHFFNMVLKDVFVKIALLDGKYAKFVPGWDMHGLADRARDAQASRNQRFPHDRSARAARALPRTRAVSGSTASASTRVRMGNFGLCEQPYRTIDPSFEATIVNALADLAEKQQIYKGLRSTLWCVHDETALAEAEIEYEHETSRRRSTCAFRPTRRSAPRSLAHSRDAARRATSCRAKRSRCRS